MRAGVAVSADGINWLRGDGLVEGHRSAAEQLRDVGVVLSPNSDNWWTLDTAHLNVSDVQVGPCFSPAVHPASFPTCLRGCDSQQARQAWSVQQMLAGECVHGLYTICTRVQQLQRTLTSTMLHCLKQQTLPVH